MPKNAKCMYAHNVINNIRVRLVYGNTKRSVSLTKPKNLQI